MFRTSFFILTLSGVAFLAPTANAQEAQAESVELSTSGVDFNKSSDVQAFHDRLLVAAHRVCDIPGDSLAIRKDNAECRDLAMRNAVTALAQPALTLVYEQNTPIEPKQMAQATAGKRW